MRPQRLSPLVPPVYGPTKVGPSRRKRSRKKRSEEKLSGKNLREALVSYGLSDSLWVNLPATMVAMAAPLKVRVSKGELRDLLGLDFTL